MKQILTLIFYFCAVFSCIFVSMVYFFKPVCVFLSVCGCDVLFFLFCKLNYYKKPMQNCTFYDDEHVVFKHVFLSIVSFRKIKAYLFLNLD